MLLSPSLDQRSIQSSAYLQSIVKSDRGDTGESQSCLLLPAPTEGVYFEENMTACPWKGVGFLTCLSEDREPGPEREPVETIRASSLF
jgi:hypothetical protein